MTYLSTLKREFRQLFDSIGIMIILFVGPLFLTLYMGSVYLHDYVNDISVAVLDEDGTTLSRMIGQEFNDSERFIVTNYPSSRGELEALIDNGEAEFGVWIPENFQENATTYESTEVMVIMDGTNLVVANNAYAQASLIIQSISAGIEMRLIQGKGVAPQIAENMALVFNVGERVLFDSKMTYMNYLIIGFLAIFLQQLLMAAMGSVLIRHKDTLSKGKVIDKALATSSALIIGFIPSAVVCMLILKLLYHVPMVGNIGLVIMMTLIFLLSLTGPALVLASITKDRVTYSQFSLMLSLPTFVASGCVWPVEQMPKLLEILIRLLWPLINYSKAVQEILIKGRGFSSVLTNIWQLLAYGVVWLILGAFLYKRAFATAEEEENLPLLQPLES